MLDDAREVFGAALKRRGHSLNTTDETLLAEARDDVRRQKAAATAPAHHPLLGSAGSGESVEKEPGAFGTLRDTGERPEARQAGECLRLPPLGAVVLRQGMARMLDQEGLERLDFVGEETEGAKPA